MSWKAMPNECRRDASDRQRVGGVAATKAAPPSYPDRRRHHRHHYQQQQQQQPQVLDDCRPSSTPLRTLDRVSLTESVWNLGRVTRAAAVHALRHSTDRAFVVRTADVAGSDQLMTSSVLHVRSGPEVRQYVIHVTRQGHWHLADTDVSFPTLTDLIAYYCEPNRRNNGLRLVLPEAIQNARTKDELRAISQISAAEFWMAMPPPLSTSTPVREVFWSQTVVKTCSPETRQVEVRSLTSHECAVISTQSTQLTDGQRVMRTVSAANRSDSVNHRGAGDKLSDYEDLWSTPTPSGHLAASPQPSKVATSVVYSYSTLPSTTRRPPSGFDPAKYQLPAVGEAATAGSAVRRSSPSVFRFDTLRPPISHRLDDVDHTQPSPIYAEPCDRLADGLRHRVAVRRGHGPVAVVTPPISASYKLPRDFLNDFDAKRSTEHHASTQERDCQPTASLTDSGSAVRSPQVVASPPSTVDDDDVAAAATVEPGRSAASADGQGPLSRDRHDDRLKIRAAAAAVRRQRRSNYDNMDVVEDESDEDGEQRSRLTTMSSARTEYSPPWDADRWRFLVDAADLQQSLRRDDVRNRPFCDCEAQRTGTVEQPEQADGEDADDYFTYSELESAASSLDDCDSITMIPLTPRDCLPPALPPRYGSESLVVGTGCRSIAARTGRSTTAAHVLRQTTTTTSGSSAVGRLNVVNNMAYRHRSPDVIPSLIGPKIISARNRGHHTPGAKIGDFIVELATRKPEQTFGALVRNFVQCTLNGSEKNPRTVLSNIRQFTNGMKNYLSNGGEEDLNNFIQAFRATMLPSEFLNLDAVMERAMVRCIVKPLKEHIYRLFTYDLTRSGSLQLLCEGLKLIRAASPESVGVQPEFLTSANQVSHFLALMEKAGSPLKKLENLLGAMTTLSTNILMQYEETGYRVLDSGVNTDDLLSTLMVILARRNLQSAEIDASYMWGLIDHSFLVGDSRYFLMTFSSAVDRLKAVRKTIENMSLGHRSMKGTIKPADQEGYITVITPDESCDILMKHSLPVGQSVLVNDLCSMLAHRLKITNPQDYSLYSLKSQTGVATRLPPNEVIYLSKSSKDLSQVAFIYKRINAYFIWSTSIGV